MTSPTTSNPEKQNTSPLDFKRVTAVQWLVTTAFIGGFTAFPLYLAVHFEKTSTVILFTAMALAIFVSNSWIAVILLKSFQNKQKK